MKHETLPSHDTLLSQANIIKDTEDIDSFLQNFFQDQEDSKTDHTYESKEAPPSYLATPPSLFQELEAINKKLPMSRGKDLSLLRTTCQENDGNINGQEEPWYSSDGAEQEKPKFSPISSPPAPQVIPTSTIVSIPPNQEVTPVINFSLSPLLENVKEEYVDNALPSDLDTALQSDNNELEIIEEPQPTLTNVRVVWDICSEYENGLPWYGSFVMEGRLQDVKRLTFEDHVNTAKFISKSFPPNRRRSSPNSAENLLKHPRVNALFLAAGGLGYPPDVFQPTTSGGENVDAPTSGGHMALPDKMVYNARLALKQVRLIIERPGYFNGQEFHCVHVARMRDSGKKRTLPSLVVDENEAPPHTIFSQPTKIVKHATKPKSAKQLRF